MDCFLECWVTWGGSIWHSISATRVSSKWHWDLICYRSKVVSARRRLCDLVAEFCTCGKNQQKMSKCIQVLHIIQCMIAWNTIFSESSLMLKNFVTCFSVGKLFLLFTMRPKVVMSGWGRWTCSGWPAPWWGHTGSSGENTTFWKHVRC